MINIDEFGYDLKRVFLIGVALLLAACGSSGDGSSNANNNSAPLDVTLSGSSTSTDLWYRIDTLPYEPLHDEELAALVLMREEEKLARDVYLRMYEIWNQRIFNNIADAEQTHMDAVLRLLEKYGLNDPASDVPLGVFINPDLQGLYDMLIARGAASVIDALIVGATIEDLDIYDLQRQLAVVDNQDIILVFENLEKGSRNHMRAFSSRLADLGIVYAPVYISQEEYEAIINSDMETGAN